MCDGNFADEGAGGGGAADRCAAVGFLCRHGLGMITLARDASLNCLPIKRAVGHKPTHTGYQQILAELIAPAERRSPHNRNLWLGLAT